jgi:nicotinamide-nucleotide amidase
MVVLRELRARGWSLATAESCTGGFVGQRLTDVPGASSVYRGGFISYANDLKTAWIDVPADLLAAHGAVSAPVAVAMARGARQRAASDIAVSVTGIAGPDGGTPEKPVGLIVFGLATADENRVRRVQLGTDRDTNRRYASQLALDLVRRYLQGLPAGESA